MVRKPHQQTVNVQWWWTWIWIGSNILSQNEGQLTWSWMLRYSKKLCISITTQPSSKKHYLWPFAPSWSAVRGPALVTACGLLPGSFRSIEFKGQAAASKATEHVVWSNPLLSATQRQQQALIASDPSPYWHGNPALHLNHEQYEYYSGLSMELKEMTKWSQRSLKPAKSRDFFLHLICVSSSYRRSYTTKASRLRSDSRGTRQECDAGLHVAWGASIWAVNRPFYVESHFTLEPEVINT